MSAPMVRALLEGRKTQTRRIVKAQPQGTLLGLLERPIRSMQQEPVLRAWFGAGEDERSSTEITCPYGKPGDLLWVRETTEADHDTSEVVTLAKYAADGKPVLYPGPEEDERGEPDYGGSNAHWWGKRDVCPSIHMPRWASRLTLELTEVRVERLQEITAEGAIAEGIEPVLTGTGERCGWLDYEHEGTGTGYYLEAVNSYDSLWESINGPGSWDANPWVWVLSFRVHKQNVDELLGRNAA
jgi:hypothetical protein